MRGTLAGRPEIILWQLSHVSKRTRPSRPCMVVTSNSAIPLPWAATHQSKVHRQLVTSRGEKTKRLQGLADQSEGPQISSKFQILTKWLIENGVEGLQGDEQRVEIYQYGEDEGGLRATTVLNPYSLSEQHIHRIVISSRHTLVPAADRTRF